MLAGIVAMQIEVLKLGASIGRSLQRGTSLQSRNEQLRASVAQLGDGQRIERLAATMGMVMPAPDGVGFVSVGPATVQKAIANIHQPNTPAFLSLSVPNGAVTGVANASGTVGASGATTGTSATGSPSASAPTTGTSIPTVASGQTTQTVAAAPSGASATTPPAPPASSVPSQPTSSASTTGAAGTAALAPAQSSSPTSPTGGAGVPAAG